MSLPAKRRLSGIFAALALGALLLVLAAKPLRQMQHNYFAFGDLRAFYCAAQVATHGGDPYLAGPIGACERGLVGLQHTDFVVPGPLPGQAVALFEPLAALPFAVVAPLWCVLLAGAYLALSFMLVRLTGRRPAYVFAACLPLAFMIPVDQGQIVPVAVTLLVAATLALRTDRDALAAILTALATIEPQLGVPACAALFLGRPRARVPLGAALALLAGLAIAGVGWSGIIEYASRVLPEHLAAEARFDDQYSLTYLLSTLHVPVDAAVALGQLSYWLCAAAATALALRLHRAAGDVCSLLFIPLAASVVTGPYTHAEHLLAAVPLAVLLTATAPAALRTLVTGALILVAWPAKFLCERLLVPGLTMHLNTAAVAPPDGPLPLLAEAAWAARIAPYAGHPLFFLAKIPSWVGLLLLVAVVVARTLSVTGAARRRGSGPAQRGSDRLSRFGVCTARLRTPRSIGLRAEETRCGPAERHT